jgi:hypothetical protein
MGVFMGAFRIGGLPEPTVCVAFRPSGLEDGPDVGSEVLRDLGILSRRLGSPTALYEDLQHGKVVMALAPVDEAVQGGIRGHEYAPVGQVGLDPSRLDDRRTLVRMVNQALRDYMASRTDFIAVGRNAYANARPAGSEDRWNLHRRMSFRVDHPGQPILSVDVGQLAVDPGPMGPEAIGGPAVLATPDGIWMARVERMAEGLTTGDPVMVGAGGERESLVEHYERLGLRATAESLDPGDPVVYLRRFQHGRPGREEPHAATFVHTVASPEETPPFDPPPSARWKIVQGMANQLGKARIGCHQVELDVEGPLCPEDQGVFQVPAEALRAGKVLQPNEETVGRWDYVRRTVLKEAGVEPGAPRLGPAVLAYQDGVPQGAATTMYSDVRYNLFRYLGTKADPHPVRVMEFSKVAELGSLLTTVTPRPSAVLVVSRDPDEGYLAAKAAVPGAAVQSMSAATLASRPVHGDEEGDPSYFNSVLWLSTALEREAGRAPWTLDTPLDVDAFLGLSVLGRSAGEGGWPERGLVVAIDARSGGRLIVGGVADLDRGRFEGEGPREAMIRALSAISENGSAPRSLVVHREGSLSRAERTAIETLTAELAAEGVLAEDVALEFVELGLDHPFRLFGEGMKGPATCRSGSWTALDDRTALLATTGYPVKTRGTPEVLMVTARSGQDPVGAARDVQTLGALDWGGREVRWPITIWGPRAEMGADRVRPWG